MIFPTNSREAFLRSLGVGAANQTASGGIVPTAEDIAMSEAAAEQLGIPVDTPVQGNEILVQGRPYGEAVPVDPSQYELESGAPYLGNKAWAQEALASRQENEKEVQHKGMFGLKGTLRDVLGTIGDAFLVQGGADRVYAPQRHQERVGDAMAGYTQAPRGAVERMTAIDPALAGRMANDVMDNEVATMNAERLAEKEAAAQREKGIRMLSQAAGGANAETYLDTRDARGMRSIMKSLIDSYGLGDEYLPPETYDENWLKSIQYSGMPPQAQVGAGQGDRRLDLTEDRNATLERQGDERIAIARKQADTAYQRMLRSGSSGSRPRSDTELEYFQALEEIPRSQRSAEENAWVDRYIAPRNSGGRSGRSGTRSSAVTGNRPRILRVRPAN